MSRTVARLIQQTIEGLTLSGAAGGPPGTDMQTAQTTSSDTSVVLLTGPINVYGMYISNEAGASRRITVEDSGSRKFDFGNLADQDLGELPLFPNYTRFTTNLTIISSGTGRLEATIFYNTTT